MKLTAYPCEHNRKRHCCECELCHYLFGEGGRSERLGDVCHCCGLIGDSVVDDLCPACEQPTEGVQTVIRTL